MEPAAHLDSPIPTPPRFAWLTPWRCRILFACIVILASFSQWRFLTHDCPIDLSGDEAQYWDWSRNLDWSYYSKGPLIAYIIRASCALLGDNMPGVRFPAILLAAGTSICTYWLTRLLFKSDRLALGAFLLGALVPMFAAGGVLITIDSPFFFLWALATCFLAEGIFNQRKWAFAAAGVTVGLGFLAKYAMFLWLPFMFLAIACDRDARKWLKSPWPWLTCAIALLFTTPVIVWNAQHDWVTLHHVATQTGANKTGSLSRSNFFEFLFTQIGIVNPGIAMIMFAGIVYTLTRASVNDPYRRSARYLVLIGLPFYLLVMLDSFRAKVQGNWAAPAYFTLLILAAYFLAVQMVSPRWKYWRGWLIAAGVFALLLQPLLRDATVLYPLAIKINEHFPRKPAADGSPRLLLTPTKFDLVSKLHGIADPFARTVSDELKKLPPGSFVLCEDYQDASQLAFYVDGQPKTYYAGSYWTNPAERRRKAQFDMWPDRRLDRPGLIGKDAIYCGYPGYAPFQQSWEKIEPLPVVMVRRNGMDIRPFYLWKCYGFKGMKPPEAGASY